jgi:predicted GNAT family acetyltransferase
MAKKDATTDLSTLELHDEFDARQFVLRVDGQRARVEYDRDGDRIFLTSIDVPKDLEPLGVRGALMEKVLSHVETKGWKLVPTNPAIKDYLRANTAWQRLLLKGVQLR